MIDDDELDQNWKGIKLQIKALQMLMTKEYDKIIILTSIVFITTVIIYVLIGPGYFNL
jgi:hypothetical protein